MSGDRQRGGWLELAILVAIIALLAWIAVRGPAPAPTTAGAPPQLHREHDDSLKVTCWTSSSGGVFCLDDYELAERRAAARFRGNAAKELEQLQREGFRLPPGTIR